MDAIIYHNPACGTSRNVLAMLEERGVRPRVVEYLKAPPSREELKAIADKAGVSIRSLLREKAPPYLELGLADPALSDEHLLDAIERHPILIERPLVVTEKGAAVCRPKERVLDLI